MGFQYGQFLSPVTLPAAVPCQQMSSDVEYEMLAI
jgi:hypothetical protein